MREQWGVFCAWLPATQVVWAPGLLAFDGRSGSGQCRLTGIVSLGRGRTRNPSGRSTDQDFFDGRRPSLPDARANQHRPWAK